MDLPVYQNYLLELAGGIAVLTVNRPEVRNAMNAACWAELCDFLDWAVSCRDVGVIILTGAGSRAFAAGADVSALSGRTGVEAWRDHSGTGAMERIQNSPKPVIAAVNGAAFGGGCELAAACDLRLASDNATFGQPEIGLGIMPGFGGTQRLARLIGEGRAKEIILGGRVLNAQEALDAGLVMKCVPQEKLLDEARALARRMLRNAPLSLALAKQAVSMALSTDRSAGEKLERLSYCMLMDTRDKEEGISAFLEKRRARFLGE